MKICCVNRAEQLVDVAPNLGELIKSKQMSLKKKLKSKFSEKKSRSVLSLNHVKDDSLFGKDIFQLIKSKFCFSV